MCIRDSVMIYLRLFLNFLMIGALSFGGGYGLVSLVRETVLSNGGLTENEFLNFIEMCIRDRSSTAAAPTRMPPPTAASISSRKSAPRWATMSTKTVSYTHLDVYKRQGVGCWFCQPAEGQYTYWVVTFT